MKQSVDFASENFAKSTDLYGFRRVRFRLLVAKLSACFALLILIDNVGKCKNKLTKILFKYYL